jgi:hypothetical protein
MTLKIPPEAMQIVKWLRRAVPKPRRRDIRLKSEVCIRLYSNRWVGTGCPMGLLPCAKRRSPTIAWHLGLRSKLWDIRVRDFCIWFDGLPADRKTAYAALDAIWGKGRARAARQLARRLAGQAATVEQEATP